MAQLNAKSSEVECLQCLASEPMSEEAARAAVRAEALADPPGALDCYPCPRDAGWHLTLARPPGE
jgi:hypothetical protein